MRSKIGIWWLAVAVMVLSVGCDSGGSKTESSRSYEYGVSVPFGKGGNAGPHQVSGWSVPEDGYTWTDGKKAVLAMAAKAGKSDLLLKVKFRPFVVAGKVEQQRIGVQVNGKKVGEWVAKERDMFAMAIPGSFVVDGLREIALELPDARMVREVMPDSRDERVVALGAESIVLWESGPYQYGTPVTFDKGGAAEPYKGLGWSHTEDAYTWTEGKRAQLFIPVNVPDSDLTLVATVIPLVGPGLRQQKVVVRSGSQRVGEWEVPVAKDYRAVIPRSSLVNGIVELTFELPNAASPQTVIGGDDGRILGLAFKKIVLSQQPVSASTKLR